MTAGVGLLVVVFKCLIFVAALFFHRCFHKRWQLISDRPIRDFRFESWPRTIPANRPNLADYFRYGLWTGAVPIH